MTYVCLLFILENTYIYNLLISKYIIFDDASRVDMETTAKPFIINSLHVKVRYGNYR